MCGAEKGSDAVIWVDEGGEWEAANKKGAWVRGTCVSGKHAGPGKLFCFLVKSDACQCIEDDSEDDERIIAATGTPGPA